LFAPIFEEIIFRGIILDGLISNHGVLVAFVTSALLFSISHGTLIQLIPTFLAGLFFAFIYYKTRSLIFTMFTHFAYNIVPIILVQNSNVEDMMQSGESNTGIIAASVIIFAAGMAGLSYYFKKT